MPLLLWSFAATNECCSHIARRFARFEQYGFRMKILSPDGLTRAVFAGWLVPSFVPKTTDLSGGEVLVGSLDRLKLNRYVDDHSDRRSESH
ncbi:hypothetical protein BLOT_011320 [Blomia tropicalis]|nr:hypothetical protein BLOT_011320 [Blomia tropicalis]